MKFTWGHAITLVFIAFASYILYFVITSFSMDIDLVAEDYYAQEVAFQSKIDATSNAKEIVADIQFEQAESGVMLVFPDSMDIQIEEGQVKFFRPSQNDLDRVFPLQLDADHRMFVPKQVLESGRYMVQLSWKAGGKDYYLEKDIVI